MEEHRDAIEADLRRFYALDLADLGSLGFSWRQLRVYIEALPPESALVTARSNGPVWGTTEYLLRNLIAALTGKVIPSPAEQRREDEKRAELRAKLAELEAWERSRHEGGG